MTTLALLAAITLAIPACTYAMQSAIKARDEALERSGCVRVAVAPRWIGGSPWAWKCKGKD